MNDGKSEQQIELLIRLLCQIFVHQVITGRKVSKNLPNSQRQVCNVVFSCQAGPVSRESHFHPNSVLVRLPGDRLLSMGFHAQLGQAAVSPANARQGNGGREYWSQSFPYGMVAAP